MGDNNDKNAQANTEQSDNSQTQSQGYLPKLPGFGTSSQVARDPLNQLVAIAKDDQIDDQTRQWLLNYAVNRFRNRRRMAYISLGAMLAFFAFLAIASFFDCSTATGADKGQCVNVMTNLQHVEGLIIWINGFLATIVATYFGMASFRPSS